MSVSVFFVYLFVKELLAIKWPLTIHHFSLILDQILIRDKTKTTSAADFIFHS